MSAGTSSKKRTKKKLTPDDLTQMCVQCGALCCRYFALEIDTPDDECEYEKIRWYLAHEATWVFIDEEKWYLLVNNKCRYLSEENLCSIYTERPAVCRSHTHEDCERSGDIFYDTLFTCMKEFEEYLNDTGENYL
jgi:uncharacterized protein